MTSTIIQPATTHQRALQPAHTRRIVARLLLPAAALLILTLAACGSSSTASSKPPFIQTQTTQGYTLTLRVAPATFGSNTFTLTLKTTANAPVSGATVRIALQMLEMDMGVQSAKLQPVGPASPGVYSGKGDLPMSGRWLIRIDALPSPDSQPISAEFHITANA